MGHGILAMSCAPRIRSCFCLALFALATGTRALHGQRADSRSVITFEVRPITAVAPSGAPSATVLPSHDGVELLQAMAVTNNVDGMRVRAQMEHASPGVDAMLVIATLCGDGDELCVLPRVQTNALPIRIRVHGLTDAEIRRYLDQPALLARRIHYTTSRTEDDLEE